jgi:hypothetical protein
MVLCPFLFFSSSAKLKEKQRKCALLPRFILLAVKSSFQVTHVENQKMELVSYFQCRL